MNEALKEIASRYEVASDRIPEILEKLPLKNPEKPTKKQIQGFERVCSLIKEGKSIEEAVEVVVGEAKNGKFESGSELPLEDEELENFIVEQAKIAAASALSRLPQIAVEKRQQLEVKFAKAFEEEISRRLNDPTFKQQFIATIEGQDLGKLNLLSGTPSNIALPSSSSSNS
jgi:hypothetical protein